MIRAGETGGVLEESLLRVADQLEKEDSLRRQIKSAMVYPTVVMTFARLVLVGLVTFLVPVFVGVFKQFGGELPTITAVHGRALERDHRLLVGVHRRVRRRSSTAFRKWKSSHRGRAQWDAFRLRIPMKIGDIVQKIALARWSRTLSALDRAPASRCWPALDITAQDRRQPRRREGDGRRHRLRQEAAARSPTR